jgi:hypothetical protein
VLDRKDREETGIAPKVWSGFLDWAGVIIALLSAAGVLVTLTLYGENNRELRVSIVEIRNELMEVRAAESAKKALLNREEASLEQWSIDQFSQICMALGGKYQLSEQYCELNNGKLLKYHRLNLE